MGGLLQSITESEISGYPELSSPLRQARDVLESIGGGRGQKLAKLHVIYKMLLVDRY